MIKFVAGKNGPKFSVGSATFTFRPIDAKKFSRWSILNSNITAEDLLAYSDKGKKAGHKKAEYKLFLESVRFIADMMLDIKGLQDDETGEDVNIDHLTYDDRYSLAESLVDQEGFGDWLDKYRAGTEKKSG